MVYQHIDRLTLVPFRRHIEAPGWSGGIASVSKFLSKQVNAKPSSSGEADAFVREHQTELLNFFRGRVVRSEDAADLAQEAWTRLMRYRHDQPSQSRRSLLFTIARNVLNNHWRWSAQRQIEQSADFGRMEVVSETPGPEREWQSRRYLQALEAAVAGLPHKCRTVFLLSRVEGLSNAQVALRCGISVKMVEKHLTKAILRCRAQVGDLAP